MRSRSQTQEGYTILCLSFRWHGSILVRITSRYCASSILLLNSPNARATLMSCRSMSKIPHSQVWRGTLNPCISRLAWYCRFLSIISKVRVSRWAVVFIDSSFFDEIIVLMSIYFLANWVSFPEYVSYFVS